ncbi:bifunctional oligoribonuclease/PAP phosphatase NrnA [Candidatus Margulisiibacteriota bacterium]
MYKELAKYLEKQKKTSMVIHVNPDGDAIGSAIALKMALKQKNLHSEIYCLSKLPLVYNFLPGFNEIKQQTLPDKNEGGIITIDCCAPKQVGSDLKVNVNLDHHIGNSYFGEQNYVVLDASATGEIIFDIIKYLQLEITEEIAECLYVSISTDTGHFKYANTTGKTFRICSELVGAGVNPSKIANLLYEQEDFAAVQAIGRGLGNMQQAEEGRIIWSSIDGALVMGAKSLIDVIREVKTCEVAVVFKKEADNKTKVSLRSKSDFDVRLFAEQYGGGGHAKAAGITIEKSLQDTETLITDALIKKMNSDS